LSFSSHQPYSTYNIYLYYPSLRCFSIVLQSLLLPSGSPAIIINGTFIEFCRPADNEHQRHMYSGYYKGTSMKWQGIATPNGLIFALCRPFARLINDWNMLQQSGILDKCSEVYANQPRLYIYTKIQLILALLVL
jgi:hypothetical protein